MQQEAYLTAWAPAEAWNGLCLPSGRAVTRERQGHSKNPPGYGFDGFGAVFSEVFAGLGDGDSAFSDQREDEVAQRGKRARAGAEPQRSSLKLTSRTWCKRFSMAQWARLSASKRAGHASATDRLVMR